MFAKEIHGRVEPCVRRVVRIALATDSRALDVASDEACEPTAIRLGRRARAEDRDEQKLIPPPAGITPEKHSIP
jgi:hypothetical protein